MANHYLVTGASRGIGFETVKNLADNDHLVTAVARSRDKLSSLRGLYPEHIRTLAADITSDQDREGIIQHMSENGLTLDGIVHNAGLLINKPFEDLTNEDWQRQLDVNLLAPVFLTRDLLKFMNPGSHILNISSMGGFQEFACPCVSNQGSFKIHEPWQPHSEYQQHGGIPGKQ